MFQKPPSPPRPRSLGPLAACLLGAALVFSLAGCQSPSTAPASASAQGGAMTALGGQSSGHEQSPSQDYLSVLSDPGPF